MKTIEEKKTALEQVCQRLCDVFEKPENWDFTVKGLMDRVLPIYLEARKVLRKEQTQSES